MNILFAAPLVYQHWHFIIFIWKILSSHNNKTQFVDAKLSTPSVSEIHMKTWNFLYMICNIYKWSEFTETARIKVDRIWHCFLISKRALCWGQSVCLDQGFGRIKWISELAYEKLSNNDTMRQLLTTANIWRDGCKEKDIDLFLRNTDLG